MFHSESRRIFMGSLKRDKDRGNESALHEWNNNKLVLIASSTFTDTKPERDILVDEIIPNIRMKAFIQNIQVIVFDMRWGLKDSNTKDHDTWSACRKVVEWCIHESGGIAFLSLQSAKYGYRPLPKALPNNEDLMARLNTLTQEERDKFNTWYKLDSNAIPNGEYLLEKLNDLGNAFYWKDALPCLLKALDGLIFEDGLRVGRSVTEYEVRTAVSLVKKRPDWKESLALFWLRRVFSVGVDKSVNRYWDFDDTLDDDPIVSAYFSELIAWMEGEFPLGDLRLDFREASFSDLVNKTEVWNTQLQSWKNSVVGKLEQSLEAMTQRRKQWEDDGCGIGVPGTVLSEILHHHHLAHTKCEDFFGRGELIQEGLDKILSIRTQSRSENSLSGLTFCLVGASGSGKTAAMSMLASEVYEQQQNSPNVTIRNRPVITRFCGTSAGSCTGNSLIQSISHQIRLCFNIPYKHTSPSQVYDSSKKELHYLLHKHPVVLFVDSLDQISDEDLARKNISFFEGVDPHVDTRIIVSTLPDERDPSNSSKWLRFYGCDTKLMLSGVPRIEVGLMPATEIPGMLCHLLERRGRRLTQMQLDFVAAQAAVEPNVLYIRLAVWVVSGLTSSTICSDKTLVGGVRQLIQLILESLEVGFGRELVTAAVGYLAFAVRGVSDAEMVDLLSLNTNVMKSMNQYWNTDRVPTHVWIRLRTEFAWWIVEREGGLLQFCHRQIWEAVEDRYAEEKGCLHQGLARYFGGLLSQSELDRSGALQQTSVLLIASDHPNFAHWFRSSVRSSGAFAVSTGVSDATVSVFKEPSIWSPHSVPNKRRCAEAAEHMIKAGMFSEAVDELCTLNAVCARAKCGSGGSSELFTMVKQLKEILRMLPLRAHEGSTHSESVSQYHSTIVNHYLRWVSKQAYKILDDPSTNIFSTASLEPDTSIVKVDVTELWNSKPCAGASGWGQPGAWVRGKMLGGSSNFDSLIGVLAGHTGGTRAAAFNFDGTKIVTAANDSKIRIWDATTNALEHTMLGHRAWATSAAFNFDGSKIVSGSDDGTARVWDSNTGVLEKTLLGKSGWILSVAFNCDGTRIVSGSADSLIHVWDVDNPSPILTLNGHQGRVRSVEYNNDSTKILSASEDSAVFLWNAHTGVIERKFLRHIGWAWSATFSHDCSKIASCGEDGKLLVWDTATGNLEHTLTEGHKGHIICAGFSHNSSKIISGDSSGIVCVWDIKSWSPMLVLKGHEGRRVRAVTFNHDSSKMISAAEEGKVLIWDGLASAADVVHVGHADIIVSVASSLDGASLVSASQDGMVCFWDAVIGEFQNCFKAPQKLGSVSFNHDGTNVFVGSTSGDVFIIDRPTGTSVATYNAHTGAVNSIVCSHDGNKVVSGGDDGHLAVWNTLTSQLEKLTKHSAAVRSVVIKPDGSQLASGSDDKTVVVWDASSGTVLSVLRGHTGSVQSVSFSGAGDRIVSGGDGGEVLIIWDAVNFQKLSTLPVSGKISAVAFNFDGSKVAACANESDVYTTFNGVTIVARPRSKLFVWDTAMSVLAQTARGHSSWVRSLTWSRYGTRIITGSDDMKVCIWEAML